MIRTRLLVAVAAAGLLATACGGGGDDAAADDAVIVVEGAQDADGDATAATSGDGGDTGDSATSDEDAAREFAQCMRDNGVEDFPDPTVSADGSVDFGFGGGAGPGDGGDGGGDGGGAGPGGAADDDLQQATEACSDLLDGTSLLPSEDDLTEIEDSLLEAAQCLRDQGLDVDDPDLGGIAGGADEGGDAGAGGGPFGDAFDPDDPEVQAAIEACQDVFTAIAPGDD